MKPSTRAFALAALALLPGAAVLHLLAASGLGMAWTAMVHATLLGWITALIYAVNFHTVPVFSGRDFPNQRLIWLQWSLFCAGIVLDVLGLLTATRPVSQLGLLLQLAAALLFVANLVLLLRAGPRRPGRPPVPALAGQPELDRIGTRATTLAGLCLPAGLLLLVLPLNQASAATVLAAEHLLALGWMQLMIVGVAYHVLPRFSGRALRGAGWARWQLRLHLLALGLMLPALSLGWHWLFAIGGLLMALACLLFGWTIWPALLQLRHSAVHVSVAEIGIKGGTR